MHLIRNKIPQKALGSVMAIGNFDGLHRGHKSVINFAKTISKGINRPLSILTFEPHPKCYFQNRRKGFRITPFRMKYELVKKESVDYFFNLKFEESFSKISAEDFILKILINKFKVQHIVTGFDFVFGHRQKGDTKLIETFALKTNSYSCSVVKEYKIKKFREFSSSQIRTYLSKGNIKKANELLGRNWSIKSRVVMGKKMARTIGYPTANLIINKYCELCFGVYEVEVRLKNEFSNSTLKGIANYGIKPTFQNSEPILEVHIFDFDEKIYGELIEVFFKSFIRKERKFGDISELKIQIKEDIKNCKSST